LSKCQKTAGRGEGGGLTHTVELYTYDMIQCDRSVINAD